MSKTKETKQPAKTKKSNAGRPTGGGAKYDINQLPDQAAIVSECKKCRSTRRAAYSNVTRSEPFGGRITVRKYTRCLDCGQHRIDRHYETISEDNPPRAA